MTEKDWLECAEPTPMLNFLRGGIVAVRDRASDRKLRLFAVGCCCRIPRLLTDQRSVNAVLVTDRYIDSRASAEELREAIRAARQAYENAFQTHDNAALGVTFLAADGYHAATSAAAYAAYAVGHDRAAGETTQAEIHKKYTEGENAEKAQQAELLRHVIGNPFGPFTVDPSWRNNTVIALAQGIYDERAFDRMPILADALEETGCTDAELVAHCRGQDPHVRGCWALDLLLNKE